MEKWITCFSCVMCEYIFSYVDYIGGHFPKNAKTDNYMQPIEFITLCIYPF